jgi:hypothetical protein
MDYRNYYDGLLPLDRHDSTLIILIECAWYCKSHHVRDMGYSQLKSISNDKLNELTKGERSDFGGTFDTFIHSSHGRKFLHVKQVVKSVIVRKKKTRIRPKIPLIQKEVKNMQLEYLAKHDSTLFRFIAPEDTVHRHRSIDNESPVSISDGLQG